MSEDIVDYPGKEINVKWDGRLCIHIGECGRARGDLFVGGRQPWCQPDVSTREEVIQVVERCPTGALTYEDSRGATEQPSDENRVMVVYNGPLYFSGDLDIEDRPGDMPGVTRRAALCRCGASNNKPFCDNSHEEAGFKDFGAVGDSGEPLSERSGTLRITPAPDGPLVISGNLTIYAASGRKAWQGRKCALCRCGASNNKPFCDGSHTSAGFEAS